MSTEEEIRRLKRERDKLRAKHEVLGSMRIRQLRKEQEKARLKREIKGYKYGKWIKAGKSIGKGFAKTGKVVGKIGTEISKQSVPPPTKVKKRKKKYKTHVRKQDDGIMDLIQNL